MALSQQTPAAVPKPPVPSVTIRAEPLPPSRLARVVRKVPVIRRLQKNRGAMVATPLKEVHPPVLSLQRNLATPVDVDVRLDVSETGKVIYAKADAGSRFPQFTEAAVDAAMRWQFTPARIGGEEVAAKVILHFRFDPTNR
jgi:TonB family protein